MLHELTVSMDFVLRSKMLRLGQMLCVDAAFSRKTVAEMLNGVGISKDVKPVQNCVYGKICKGCVEEQQR